MCRFWIARLKQTRFEMHVSYRQTLGGTIPPKQKRNLHSAVLGSATFTSIITRSKYLWDPSHFAHHYIFRFLVILVLVIKNLS